MSDEPFDLNTTDLPDHIRKRNDDWILDAAGRRREVAISERLSAHGLEKAIRAGAQQALSDYARAISEIVIQAYSGSISQDDFELDLDQTVRDGLEGAWRMALEECGISEHEAVDTDYEVLDNEQDAAERALFGFQDFVFTHTKADGYELMTLMPRTGIWVNRWIAVYNGTRAQSCLDMKLKWVWSPEKEHCEDCATLNGRVYRASVWYNAGVYPQNPELACHGFNCGCHFEETSDPITPGEPPALKFSVSPEAPFG